MVSSVELLLSQDETELILTIIDELMSSPSSRSFAAGAQGHSIHGIPSLDVPETIAVYEPQGRIEIESLPRRLTEIVDNAIWRSRIEIQRALPWFREIDDWIYVEYGVGQYVTPHIDYARNLEKPDHPKLVGVSIQLNDDFSGGEFYVETCSSNALWTKDESGLRIVEAANNYSDWFRRLARTRWTATPSKGSALLYGSRVIHGTNAVTLGRSRKLIGWLLA